MKTFRVEIKTFVFSNAGDALDAIAQARYRFMQVCKVANATDLARDASYDVSVMMCPKCHSADCPGCEKQQRIAAPIARPVPVIQRDRE